MTTEAAVCLDDSDQSVCLLRLIWPEATPPLSARAEFANAEAELNLIAAGRDAPRAPTAGERAVIDALRLDKSGADARTAMRPITELREKDVGIPGYVTSADQRRAIRANSQMEAAREIWRQYSLSRPSFGYRPPWPKASSTRTNRPNSALVRAALKFWELSRARYPSNDVFNLADAYEELGDRAGRERVIRASGGWEPILRLRDAVARNDVDASVKLALRIDPRPSEALGIDYWLLAGYRQDALALAVAAGRNDLVTPLAQSIVDEGKYGSNAAEALEALARIAPDQARAATLLYDAQARAPAADTGPSAIMAVAGWHTLGEREREDDLIALWRTHLPKDMFAPCDAICAPPILIEMLRRADRLEEAWALGWFMQPVTAIVFDEADGYGLRRLDAHLTHGSARDQEHALYVCVSRNALEGEFTSARTCLDKLVAIGAARPLDAQEREIAAHAYGDAVGGPFVAASAALYLGTDQVSAGMPGEARDSLHTALRLWANAPPAVIKTDDLLRVTELAIADLASAGRLSSR